MSARFRPLVISFLSILLAAGCASMSGLSTQASPQNANALAARAIRTCGGQAMLKNLPLERIYRDSRCGSLMLPWTAEICLDRLGRETLYEPGEKDD